MKKNLTRALTESAVMLAVATALSMFKLIDLPYGGSVTIASMLPILIIAYRYGVKWGLLTGAAYGGVQQLLGLKTLSYVSTWQSVVAVILLDYIVAFMVIGFGGSFRRMKSQPTGMVLGGLLVGILRYLCHIISGATVWAGLSIPTNAALIYSIGYNGTYMIPETIVLLIAAYYLGSKLDFRADQIGPYKAEERRLLSPLDWVAGLLLAGACIFDTASVFMHLQNAEAGDFDITGLSAVDWKLILFVTVLAVAGALILFYVSRKMTGYDRERVFEYVLSFLVPLAGFILGCILLAQDDQGKRQTGKMCAIIALVPTILSYVVILDRLSQIF